MAERPGYWPPRRSCAAGVSGDPGWCRRQLLAGGVVLLGNARRYAPAVADRDALVFRPRPDAAAALTSRCRTAGPAALPASRLTGVLDERRELPAEPGGIPGAQIDHVLRAAQPELQRLVGTAAVQIIFHDDAILVAIGTSHEGDGLLPYRPGSPTAAVTCAVTDPARRQRQVALAYGFITGARTCRPQRRSSECRWPITASHMCA